MYETKEQAIVACSKCRVIQCNLHCVFLPFYKNFTPEEKEEVNKNLVKPPNGFLNGDNVNSRESE